MTKIQNSCLLYFVFFILLSCGNSEEQRNESESGNSGLIAISQEQFSGSDMKLGELKKMEFPTIVEATGLIDVPPENKAMISSFADGYVKSTPLLIGDRVQKGQFLLSLENPEYVEMQQAYLDTREQLSYLKSEYERQKSLFEEKITSEKNYLKAESEYKRNLARYNGMKKKLEMLNLDPASIEQGKISSVIRLYAPITGSITDMNVNNGMFVSASDELMKIIDPEHLHLELDVFEKDVLKVKKGQEIKFRIPEAQSDTLEGEIYLVGTSIGDARRTVKVHGHFKDEEQKRHLATGMFVQSRIITSTDEKMALPESSIVSVENKHFVLVLEKKDGDTYLFRRREVVPGDMIDGFTSIRNSSEFEEGSRFLVKGAFSLLAE